MRENVDEKSLIKINENSIFYKIKSFFKNVFHKEKSVENVTAIENGINVLTEKENNKNSFMESIKNVEDEEIKLLKLQKKYRNREVKVRELTEEQINSLSALYNKQIANLRKSNEIKKQRLLEYRRKLQTDD